MSNNLLLLPVVFAELDSDERAKFIQQRRYKTEPTTKPIVEKYNTRCRFCKVIFETSKQLRFYDRASKETLNSAHEPLEQFPNACPECLKLVSPPTTNGRKSRKKKDKGDDE